MSEIVITKENFEKEVLECRDMPILIDFWASWCGPCMMLSPIIAEIADEMQGRVKVCKVNVDEQPELSAMFRVESIPLLAVVKDGKITAQSAGYRPKEKVLELLR